jgi:hypothetical protein
MQRRPPRASRRPELAEADGDRRVAVVVVGDHDLHPEVDQRRRIDLRHLHRQVSPAEASPA